MGPLANAGDRPFSRKALVIYLLLTLGVWILSSVIVAWAGAAGLVELEGLGGAVLLYVLNFLVFAGMTFLIAIRPGKIGWATLGLAPPRWRWVWLLLAAGVAIVLMPGRIVIAAVVQWLFGGFDALQSRMDLFAGELTWGRFLITLAGAGVLAPLSEELFFRGFVYTALRSHVRVWPAVFISSVIFAAGHFDAAGVVAASLIAGIAFALLYEYTRSLWVTIAAHAINNSLAVVLTYLLLLAREYLEKLQGAS